MPTTEADRPVRLATARLLLRRPEYSDAPAIAGLADDREVARHTARLPHPYSLEDAKAFLDLVADGWADRSERVFAITSRANSALVGMVGLITGEADGCGEIGYWLGRAFWGRGYMTEAVGEILRYALDDIGLRQVKAAARPENLASIRVQEKVGMSFVGCDVEDAPARGRSWQVEVRAIDRSGPAP